MKLNKLIERLLKIKEEKGGDIDVSIMEEHEIEGKEYQLSSKVKDVASSNRSGVIIIGQELD